MGRIDRLEILDFKSYAGHQIVGPFRNFTCIIGPNGAGKSNLMEAISFVLGVRSRDLRSTNLKDLIFKRDGETLGRRKAYVKLVYENDEGEQIHFTRSITAAGQTQYSIGNSPVTWEEYDGRLRQFNILVKARNFLVFQGDVESIAQKNPRELTNLFEQISGSEELKKKYEEALEAKDKAEQNTSFAYSKKRGMAAERKQYKEQKEEAERYNRLQQELAEKKLQMFLFELHFIDAALKKENSGLAELSKEQTEADKRCAAAQDKLKEKRKAQATLQKEALKVEREASKIKAELEAKRPQLEKMEQAISRLESKIEKGKESCERISDDCEKQAEEIQKTEKSVEDIERQLEQITAEASQGMVQLEGQQLVEYSRLKEELANKTVKDQAALGDKTRAQKTDKDELEIIKPKCQALQRKVEDLTKQAGDLEADRDKTEEQIGAVSAKIAQLKQDRLELVNEFQTSKVRRDELQKKLQDLDEEIGKFKTLRRETDKEKELSETLASLRRLYPSVHGRLSDLCKPAQRRYNHAVTVVMGKNMDSVVVETEAVARECVKYLKETQKQPMTFLPLDSIRPKPLNESLRQLGGTTKLLVDTLQFEQQYLKAVLYAVGNTVVFDTLHEARRLAFRPEQRLKAVTIDGVQISKSGVMTGGSTGSSDRWDEKEAQGLKTARDAIEKELTALGRTGDAEAKAGKIMNEITKLESELRHLKVHKDDRSKKIKRIRDDLAKVQKELSEVKPQLEQLETAIESRASEILSLQNKIDAVANRIFASFCRAVGVDSIKDYEERQVKQAQERSKLQMELETHRNNLQQDLQFKKTRNLKAPLEKMQATVAHDEKELKKSKKQEKELAQAMKKLETELEDFGKKVEEIKGQVSELDVEMKVFKKEEAEASKRLSDVKKKLTAKETEIEKHKTKRDAVFQCSNLEEIRLPMATEGDDPMELDDGQEPAASTSQASNHTHLVQVDYTNLGSDLKKITKQEQFEKAFAEIEAEIKNLQVEMERIAPNMNAIARLEDVNNRLKETSELFDQNRKEAEDATRGFNQIRQQRYDRFMEAFNHVSERIDKVYKDLTRSKDHPTGGSATLVLEDPEEPYNKGIQFTSMPPLKRFRGMEQLSGGEKTVAALALLFAIHSYQPSPFFVLDEVDAALDNINVNRVANYIRKRTIDDQDFQAVVISLKDTFYEKAEALVGVHKDSEAFSSGTLTLDLTQYG